MRNEWQTTWPAKRGTVLDLGRRTNKILETKNTQRPIRQRPVGVPCSGRTADWRRPPRPRCATIVNGASEVRRENGDFCEATRRNACQILRAAFRTNRGPSPAATGCGHGSPPGRPHGDSLGRRRRSPTHEGYCPRQGRRPKSGLGKASVLPRSTGKGAHVLPTDGLRPPINEARRNLPHPQTWQVRSRRVPPCVPAAVLSQDPGAGSLHASAGAGSGPSTPHPVWLPGAPLSRDPPS